MGHIKETMRSVMTAERDAIDALLQEKFDCEPVISVLSACKGHIVFMGVGKSGHIGKKLAATFASLGIPSFFVHATEAMHGDLGMIGKEDVAVLISNSGTTQEVVQCVAPLRKNGVTTVAFTAGEQSALAQNCDHVILYPKLAEADALGLAPTVSSTLTLVLGDAIACSLSETKHFTRDEFHSFHPNGALGQMLSQEKKDG